MSSLTTVPNLEEIAKLINAAHMDCMTAFEASQEQAHRSLASAREAGKLLNQAKAEVQWGAWLKWVGANCPDVSERTCQAYMQIDREWESLQALPGFNQLNYSTALALLGKLNQPDPVEVVEGELVEPEAPTPKPAQFQVGQQAVVINSGNLHSAETVEIIDKKGQILIGRTSKGDYPFLPGELRSTDTPSLPPQKAQVSPKEKLNQAFGLLKRCRQSNLPLNLAEEIDLFLG